MAANRQSNVVVGNGKKLATLINKRNEIVKIRVFIDLLCLCYLTTDSRRVGYTQTALTTSVFWVSCSHSYEINAYVGITG